ncbi:heat shock Hsp20 [Micractinium conductrix]|uniref:Heat shock Hsp20 n=1 Tax=Micractinium conductrix TaxID=554055 RepID=A0A2P6VDG6_9CHLO|nr:heat shock Hsp20 [Micractinium conductrix]|eukprot:PSC72119.1 heat shock Hsp20 [Micractinium conductrix]
MASLRLCLRAPALRAPVAFAARRRALAVPAQHRFHTAVRAEKAQPQEESPQSQEVVRAPEGEQRAVAAPRGAGALGLVPSFSRMNQMMRTMEEEMSMLSRAFGMPSLMPSSLFDQSMFDLPAAADLPAVAAKSLAVDIKDTGKSLEIVADVPGMNKEDIKVQVSPDRVLTISGERKSEHREGSEEEGNLRVERSFGSFMRRFRLPEAVDVEGIKANVKDGVLRLEVPKTEAAQPKQIDINVAE